MSVVISYPAIRAVPLDGLMSPVNMLNVVVLPAPASIKGLKCMHKNMIKFYIHMHLSGHLTQYSHSVILYRYTTLNSFF